MKKRSKFLGLILNFIPGFGQMYCGDSRGLAVMILTALGVFSCLLLAPAYGVFGDLVIAGYIFMFIVSELMLLTFRVSDMEYDGARSTMDTAFLLSFIPGLGHLYLGLMEKGLVLLAAILICVFLTGWLGSALFIFLIPILLAYSVFDIKMILENRAVTKSELGIKPWMGYFLIFAGIYVILEKMVVPYINFAIMRKVRVLIIAVGMIIGGLVIIKPELFGIIMKKSSFVDEKDAPETNKVDVIEALEEGDYEE